MLLPKSHLAANPKQGTIMKTYITPLLITLAMTVSATVSPSSAADWGTLKGRLIYEGDPIKPDAINVNKDVGYCGKHGLVDETIAVGEKGGLQNVFIYLYVKRGKSVDVHPDLEKPPGETLVLDNKGCRFEPHGMILRTGQTLEIRNSDPGIGHNTNAVFLRNPVFNELVSDSKPLVKVFNRTESFPSAFACNIHPWMKAFVLIRDNPYMAITGADGSFEIRNIPAGKHEFIFWQEGVGTLRKLEVGGTKTSRKGRAKLEIPAGETLDLGDVKVSAKVLGK